MPDVPMAIHRELSGENALVTATDLTAFHRGRSSHSSSSVRAPMRDPMRAVRPAQGGSRPGDTAGDGSHLTRSGPPDGQR